jgi:lipopolysaccharide transport system permease protein
LLIWRDFVSKYKQTILGPLWFIIQPLLTTVVFTIIFGKVARIPTDSLPPFLFYLSGIVIWDYFARCFNGISTTFIDNAQVFGKVYFPRLVVPLSVAISNLIALAIQLMLFLGFYFYFRLFTPAGAYMKVNIVLITLPLIIIQAGIFGLGAGLWMAASTAKYRDLIFVTAFIIQLWMYATPVIYPVSAIPDKWRFILAMNPMTAIVEAFRYGFFGVSAVNANHLALSIIVTIAVLFSGIIIFNRVERTFIDTV